MMVSLNGGRPMNSVNQIQDQNDYLVSSLFDEDQIDKVVRKADDIMASFGYRLHYEYGRWHACESGERPGWHRHSARSLRELIGRVIPQPPTLRTPGWSKYWAKECLEACAYYGDIKPEALAKAAFEAYDLVPTVDEFGKFIEECEMLMNKDSIPY
jgi:hypothetical protein